jgi:hypothetical protein
MKHAQFSPEQLSRLGKQTDLELAREWNCSWRSIQNARKRLGIRAFREHVSLPACDRVEWPENILQMLGKVPDRDIARLMRCSARVVSQKRRNLNIPYVVNEETEKLRNRRLGIE